MGRRKISVWLLVARALNLATFMLVCTVILSGGIVVGTATAWNYLPEESRKNPDANTAFALLLVLFLFLLSLFPLFEWWIKIRQRVDNWIVCQWGTGGDDHVAILEREDILLRRRLWSWRSLSVYISLELGAQDIPHRRVED